MEGHVYCTVYTPLGSVGGLWAVQQQQQWVGDGFELEQHKVHQWLYRDENFKVAAKLEVLGCISSEVGAQTWVCIKGVSIIFSDQSGFLKPPET